MSFDKLSYHKGDALSLPKGWEIKKLGEICKVIAGQSPEGKFYNSEGNGMPFYQGKKEYGEKYIGEPTTWTTKVTKEAEAGDILMSVRAPVGPVNFATQKICIGRGLAALRAGKHIDKEFLYNFLINHENEIEGNAGAVFNSINKTQIENIEIPLPPLPEQQRIVSILDEAFAAIAKAKANAEQNLKNAKELFESYLQGIMSQPRLTRLTDSQDFKNQGNQDNQINQGSDNGDGWEEKKLGEVCEFKGGGTPSTKNKNYWNGSIPWVSPKDMKSRLISISEDYITDIAVKESSTSIIPIGSILIVVRSGILSRIVPLGLTIKEVTVNQDLKALIPKRIISSEYLFYFLEAKMKFLLSKVSRGATVHRLTTDSIREISIPIPSKETQQTIVRQLDALRTETQKLEAVYQKKMDDLEELRKSILQKAFSGRIA